MSTNFGYAPEWSWFCYLLVVIGGVGGFLLWWWLSGRYNRMMGGPTLERMVIHPQQYGVSLTHPFVMYYIQKVTGGVPSYWTGERFHFDRRRVKLFFTASEAVEDYLRNVSRIDLPNVEIPPNDDAADADAATD